MRESAPQPLAQLPLTKPCPRQHEPIGDYEIWRARVTDLEAGGELDVPEKLSLCSRLKYK